MNPIKRFFQGINYFFSGWRMLFRSPSLLGLAIIPIVLTIVVLFALAWGGAELIGFMLGERQGIAADGRLLLQLLFFLLVLFVAYLIYLPMTRIFLAPFSERLSLKTAKLCGFASLPMTELSFVRSIWEGVKIVALQLLIVLLVLLLTMIFPPVGVPLGVFVTLCFCGMDFLDVPLSTRGLAFGKKLSLLWKSRALVLGFALAAYVLLHIPLINLLTLPVGVVGATLLVNRIVSEQTANRPG